jgi:glycosyltransferase involved in cell wall biosynthesis
MKERDRNSVGYSSDAAAKNSNCSPVQIGATGELPLSNRTVVLVHPAWHSCGSYQVFVTQAQVYQALGAAVMSLAISDAPGQTYGSRAYRDYMTATGGMDAHKKFYAGMPLPAALRPQFLKTVCLWLRGNFAAMTVKTAELVKIPAELMALPRIDLIHCNHFFSMPVAAKLQARHGCPILLDTHDLQARQFALRNAESWTLPPRAKFEDMLAIELAALARADVLIHLNDEEAAAFKGLLPEKRHVLIYPAVPPVPGEPGGSDLVIVASANVANYLSISWFLEKVLPLVPHIPVKIIGNVDMEFRMRAPELFKAHASLFLGRVPDLNAAYRNAAAILLPTVSGHGISIKTIEAMSSGAPLIATQQAFRGMQIDAGRLANVTLADDPKAFADAMRRAFALRYDAAANRVASDTRRAYERLFGFDAYCRSLGTLVQAVLQTDGQ